MALQPVSLKVQMTAEVEVAKVRTMSRLIRHLHLTQCSYCRYAVSPVRRPPQLKTAPAVARTCNLIFIVLDVLKPLGDKKIIESELEAFGIRLNKRPPNITVKKKDKGGIAITNTVPLTNIDHDEIKAVCSEYKLSNADVAIREPNATADDLVDVIEGNR